MFEPENRGVWHLTNNVSVYDKYGEEFRLDFESKLYSDRIYNRVRMCFTPYDILKFLFQEKQLDSLTVHEDNGSLIYGQNKKQLKDLLYQRAKGVLPDLEKKPYRIFQGGGDMMYDVYFAIYDGAYILDEEVADLYFTDIDEKTNNFDIAEDKDFQRILAKINS